MMIAGKVKSTRLPVSPFNDRLRTTTERVRTKKQLEGGGGPFCNLPPPRPDTPPRLRFTQARSRHPTKRFGASESFIRHESEEKELKPCVLQMGMSTLNAFLGREKE